MATLRDTLTLAEAAQEAGLDPSTLRWQIKNGKLEAMKKGRDWLVTRSALTRYLKNRAPSGRRAKAAT
jgi:excisionase family DNA binding protein